MSHLQKFRDLEAQGIDILAILAGDRIMEDQQLEVLLEKLGPLGEEYHRDLIELLTHRRFEVAEVGEAVHRSTRDAPDPAPVFGSGG